MDNIPDPFWIATCTIFFGFLITILFIVMPKSFELQCIKGALATNMPVDNETLQFCIDNF